MDKQHIQANVTEITPTEAAQLATAFRSAGKVDQKLIRAYSDDMAAERWMLNGASVVLSREGKVLDGRARLLACAHSKAAFRTLVISGVDDSAFETIDSVRKRRLADVLTIRRFPHGRALAAALRLIHAHRTHTLAAPRNPSPMVLLDLLEAHPEIRDSIIPSLRGMPLMPHGTGIAMHYLFSLVSPKKADAFFAQLGTAPIGNQESPALNLRKTLEELRAQGGYRKQVYVIAVSIKAWNAFHSGKPVKQLRFSPAREPFPEIRGLTLPTARAVPAKERSSQNQTKRGQHEITARVEMITPELADRLLSSNTINRGIAGSVVEKYARDMRDGRWRLNGQTIKVTSSGRLLDGQHRLEAVKKANRPFPAIIVEGVPESCLASLDIGHRRSLSEILRDRGETNTATLASALRWLWMLEHGVVLAANSSPTNGEMLELLEQSPDIRRGQKYVSGVRDFMGSGVALALHFVFGRKSRDQSDTFFERLGDGLGMISSSPIYQLRERFIKQRSLTRLRVAEAERVALTIKAWNAYRESKPLQQLSWRTKGAARELLPSAI